MFKNTLYILSDGTKTKNCPYFFSDRDKLVDEAKEVAKNLRWTKKLKGEDFFDVWLNDEDVKKYRKLLKEIWGFAQDLYIVSENVCCGEDDCFNAENLVIFERFATFYKSSYGPDRFIYCQDCADKAMKFWGDSDDFEARIVPYVPHTYY